MKVYEAIFNEESVKGVYGISLVESPAIMEEWIMLTEQPKEIKFAAVDDTKNLLLGAVLIPEQRIYRNMDGNEFEMKFSADTIERLAHNFQKQSFQNNSSLEHETKLSDVTFAETWIVQDTENDKSNAFGKTYPKGTWVAMSKVSNEVYAKAKSGEIKGFSIDALLQLTEVKFKNEVNMSVETKSITDAIKEGFNALLGKTEVAKEEVKLMDEPVMEEPKAEEEPATDVEALKEAIMGMLAEFSLSVDKKIEDVKVEFSTAKDVLVKENEDLKVELSKETEVEPLKTKGEAKVEFKDMSNFEKMEYRKQNKH
mgnify:CR=1 FL=1|tara:strand:+ start:8790 stop:9725 length:936 start_codon:yes stop_codon:yes gene_type:complete